MIPFNTHIVSLLALGLLLSPASVRPLPAQEAVKTEVRDINIQGGLRDGKGRLVIEADLGPWTGKPQPLIFATALQQLIHASLEKLSHTFRLQIDVIQGDAKEIALVLAGEGTIRQVTGEGLQDWSVRQEAGGARLLVVRWKTAEKPAKSLSLVVEADTPWQELPSTITPLTIRPSQPALFSGFVRLDYDPKLEVSATNTTGVVPVELSFLPEAMRAAKDTGIDPLTYRFQGAPYTLPLALRLADPEAREVILRNFRLTGRLEGERATFTLSALARVKHPKGGTTELLSGNIALTDYAPTQGWRLQLDQNRFLFVTEQPGDYPIELTFDATVQQREGWKSVNFRVAGSTLQPVVFEGLAPDTQFQTAGAARPERVDNRFVSFLPPSGQVNFSWKEARPETEGRLFYAADMLAQIAISPGLMRQNALFDFKVMQGELNRVTLLLQGQGEITRVQGAGLLAWNVEPVAGSADRRLVVQLNQAQKDSFSLQVQVQTPLGAFPQTIAVPRLQPEGATRFAGYFRIVNEGAVRLEVLQSAGLSQISPEQFPETDATRALLQAQSSQRFAFRFSGAGQQLQIQADNILPELSVAQVLQYHLGETELVIEGELELDIREAPVRELLLRIPKGYAIARLTASGLSDYFTRDEENQAELRLVYGQPVSGRQVVHFRLERNKPLDEAQWALPPIEVVKVKSVRGHLGVSSDAGLRLTPTATEGLTDVATAFFPRKVANLHAAFRLNEPAWRATLLVERLPQSIQADAMHLFSIGEGIAYGSSVLNYQVSGAPISALRVELSAEYFNVEFTGKDVRNWQKTQTGYTVQLHSPVSGAYALLATYERPFKAQGDTLGFTGARPLDAQSEQGHTLVISAYQFQVKPVNLSTGLLPLDPAEVPAEYRLLFDAPILAAYRYAARPFNLQLQLSPLAQADTLGQVVDRAALTTRISKEGQVLTEARYFVKNHGTPHFRLMLPEGMQLWSATVNGATVVPVRDGSTNLVPLPQRSDPNAIHELVMKYATRSKTPERVTVSAPVVSAPVLLAQWNVLPDAGQRLLYRQGKITPAIDAADASGFAGLMRLFTGRQAATALMRLIPALGLILIAVLVARWTNTPGIFRFSLRHILGAVLCVVAAGFGIIALLNVVELASRQGAVTPGNLTFLAPVQQSGTVMSVEVANLPDQPRAWDYIKLAVPVAFALLLWGFAALVGAGLRRTLAVVLGWFVLFWAVLRWPNSAPVFFLLLLVFLLVHAILPAIRQLFRLPPRPARTTPPSDSTAATAATAVLCLLAATSSVTAAPAKAPPVAAAVTQEIQVTEQSARAQAAIRWRALKGQTLPVLYEPAVLTAINYPTNALRLIPGTDSGKRAQLLIAQEDGDFNIELKYQLDTSVRDNDRGVVLPTRHGLINQVRLVLSGLNMDVRSPQAVSVDRTTSGTNTVATLVLSPVNDAWISWKPRARDTSQEKPVFYAEWAHLFVPTPGLIEATHQVQIRPAQGELTELLFDVPPGTTITEVMDVPAAAPAESAKTPSIVSVWRFDPDARKLRVTLKPPQLRPFTLLLKSQVATGPLPFEQAVGVPAIQQAAGQIGLIGVGTSTEVQLDNVAAGATSPINLEDFPATLAQTFRTAGAGVTVRRAFRYQALDTTISIKASAVEPDVRVETSDTLSLGEDRTVLAANWSVEITRAGIFRLSFVLPAGMDVETVSGPALSHWTELKSTQGRVITMHLRGKTEGQQQFALTLIGPGTRTGTNWAVPKLVAREASKQQGQLLVVPEQGLRLQVASRDGLTQLDPQKAGVRQKGVLAFRLLHGQWSLALDLEQLAPWVQVTSLQHVTFSEVQMKVAANLHYQIENTGLKSLRVSLPTNAENVRFVGDQIADSLKREIATNGTRQAWEIKLHRRVIGKYRLQVVYQVRLPEGAREAVVGGVEAQGADLQRGYLTVQASGRLQARIDQFPAALQPTEWQSIPKALSEGIEAATANYTFRLVEPGFRLPIQLARHETARLLPARVNRTTLTSVVSDDGEMLTQVSLDMTPGDKRLLRLKLPADARFWFAFVNQHSVWPWREQDEILIPLEHQSKPGQTMPVELFYSSHVGSTRSRDLDFNLAGPKFDLPLESITWRVYLNEKWRLKDWTGTLQLNKEAGIAPTSSIDLQTYLQNENEQRRNKTKEAEQLLVLGQDYLQKGDPQQARRAFQTAYGISTHDAAFNEDARVKLNNLKVQQALVGLNMRQAAVGGDAAAATNRLQTVRGANEPAYTQQQAQELFGRNTAEDNAAFTRLAERLIQQQDAAIANPAAIRATIPEQGRLLVFSRAIQVDPWTDMRIGLEVARTKAASFGRKTILLFGILIVLAIFAGIARTLRRPIRS